MSMSDPSFRRVAETPGVLTERELEVLRLRAAGVPVRWICVRLGLRSTGTVSDTIRRAEAKVYARMREQAA